MSMTTLLLLPFLSSAYFYSGNDLRVPVQEYFKAERSDHNTDYSKAYEYRGYALGVYDATSPFLCTPENVTAAQILTVVANYFNNNPHKWHMPAKVIIQSSLFESFPCPAKSLKGS